jgi:hypothetical protein
LAQGGNGWSHPAPRTARGGQSPFSSQSLLGKITPPGDEKEYSPQSNLNRGSAAQLAARAVTHRLDAHTKERGMVMRRIAVGLIAAMAMLLAPGRLAVGEVFVLGNGGQVTGELLNPDESPRKTFIIKTSTGGQITLDRSQVVEVHRPSPEELLYERIRPNYPDTVEGQWALAECQPRRGPPGARL